MSNQKVIMICEVQVLLDQYLKARKQMHLLYKVVRADSCKHLAKQFAVADVKGRPENATWVTEEKRYVEKTFFMKHSMKFVILEHLIFELVLQSFKIFTR